MTEPYTPEEALRIRYAKYAKEIEAINEALVFAIEPDGIIKPILLSELGITISFKDLLWVLNLYQQKGWKVLVSYDDDYKPATLHFSREER